MFCIVMSVLVVVVFMKIGIIIIVIEWWKCIFLKLVFVVVIWYLVFGLMKKVKLLCLVYMVLVIWFLLFIVICWVCLCMVRFVEKKWFCLSSVVKFWFWMKCLLYRSVIGYWCRYNVLMVFC